MSRIEQRVEEIFHQACEMPSGERDGYIEAACGGDVALRAAVRSLLREEEFDLVGQITADAVSGGSDETFPRTFGDFVLWRVLGEGGMGCVYEAEQGSPRRRVAVKVIRAVAMSRSLLRRIRHEADVLGQLKHPGIAQIFQVGSVLTPDGQSQPYLAMELINGLPLTEFASRHGMDASRRLALLARVCDAVQHAHQRGVVHRDLKPGNVLVEEEPGATGAFDERTRGLGQPKVLDFGIARLLAPSDAVAATLRTEAGQIVGTLAYMSPEQASGDTTEVDTRSDVYSLGVMGYELLAGRLPIDAVGKPITEAVKMIREQVPRKLGTIDRRYRGDTETIIAKAMEKEPARRYASAAEFAADIRRSLANEPIVARPGSAVYQLRRFTRRHRTPILGTAVAVAAVIGGLAYGLVKAHTERDRARDAETAANTEARISDAINTFLNDDVLAAVSPDNTPNPDIRMRDVLDAASKRIEGRFPDAPLVEAGVRMTLGVTYMRLGELDTARVHMDRGLALRRAHLSESDPKLFLTMLELVELTFHQGDYPRAEALGGECLERSRALLGADHKYAQTAAASLGFIKMRLGKAAEAGPLMAESLEAMRRTDPSDPEIVPRLINLAMFRMQHRQFAEAEPLIREAIQTGTALLGVDNPQTILAAATYGAMLNSMQRYADAIPALRAAIDSQSRVLGANHPQTMTTRANLGFAFVHTGDFDQAETILQDVLRERRAQLGEAHPHTLNTLLNLGVLRTAQHRLDEADEFYRDGERLARPAEGEVNPLHVRFIRELVGVSEKRGDAAAAEGWRRQLPPN